MKTIKYKSSYEYDTQGKGTVSAIVFPESIHEIETVVKLTDQDIIPRGANTSGGR